MECRVCGCSIDRDDSGAGTQVCQLCEDRGRPQFESEVSVHAVRKALTKRLAAILRRFDDVPSGERDIQSIQSVLKSVRGDIATGYGPNGEDLDYIEIAGQLSFAVSPLKRAGHEDLVEEVLLVKQTIEKLATVTPRVVQAVTPSEETPPTVSEEESDAVRVVSSARRDSACQERSFSVVQFVLIAVVVGLALVAGAWFLLSGKRDEGVSAEIIEQTLVVDSPVNPLDPTGSAVASGPDYKLFWDLVGESKRAIQLGEAEEAVEFLDRAAVITREKSELFSTAELIKQRFISMAQVAITKRNWEYGDALLARSIDVAADYGLALKDIDHAVGDLGKTEWEYRISPSNPGSALVKLVGVETIIELHDGSAQAGTVREIRGGQVILEEQETLGGGKMGFSAKIDLTKIRFVTYKGQPDLSAVEAARERLAQRDKTL